MGSDCTVGIDGGYINLRVGAIIMKDGKFLMMGNEGMDALYSVGGRIQFGESAEEAVVREVWEETGWKLEVDRLGFIHENFFYNDYRQVRTGLIYETSWFFYMKVPEDFEPNCESRTEYGDKEFFAWVTPGENREIYPQFFHTELQDPKPYMKYFFTDGRK